MPSPYKDNVELLAQGKKRCTKCNRVKSLSSFYKRKDGHGGRKPVCKLCFNRHNLSANSRTRTLTRLYGITSEQWDVLFVAKGGKCWICGGGSTKRLAVDHNHKNNNVRGLLCSRCNSILGKWRDNPAIARRAAEYLENDGSEVAEILR